MKATQYLLSLNTLYRLYPRNLSSEDYDYLSDMIEHYSAKKSLTQKEAEEAESKCKTEWKKYFLAIFKKLDSKTKKYVDIIKEEDKSLKKIKSKVELDDIPLGEYENLWDDLDNTYRKIESKINSEKRNFKRNWKGHIISFIIGIIITVICTIFFKVYLGW